MTAADVPLADLVRLMHLMADASAATILANFRNDPAVEDKGNGTRFDPVTEADRNAETVLRECIEAAYGDHAILGEEYGNRPGSSRYRWVIDPIDGTRAFILGLPTWGTLIGLEIDGRPTIGMMNQPFTRDRFWTDGTASYAQSADGSARRIASRERVTLRDAQLASTHPNLFTGDDEAAAFRAICNSVKASRFGTDCFGYTLLAAGLVDLVVEAGLKPYDIVALIPIVENAGGVVTTWEGATAQHGGRIVAAANRALHAEALNVLAGKMGQAGHNLEHQRDNH